MSDDAHEASEVERPSPPKRKAKVGASAYAGPRFARNFPDDPELRALVEAFERGAHNLVRDRAPKLAQQTSDPEVARAALELHRRLDPDPLAVKLLLASIGLLIFLSAWAYHTAH
jgi:hypothetical protein